MKAFEAPGRKTPVAQNFAEGGLVKQLKGMFGMDEERNARIAEYKRQRDAEKAAAAPAPAPAPAPAITDYSSGGALKRREQAAGLKDGGPVRGPGTGTSDEVQDEVAEGTYIMPTDSTKAIGEQALAGMGSQKVPVNLSNGEFKLPPEQVHAIGVQALDQMKGATHTPSSTEAAKGMKPELFFEGGGVASEQERLRRQTQAYVTGAQATAAARPAEPVAQAVAPQPAAPVASPARASGPSALYMADRTQEMGDQWKAGNYAGAVGTGVRTAAQGLGMYGIEAADKTLSPWIDAGQRMVGGVLGTDTPAGAVKTSAAAPVAPAAPTPASAKAAPVGAQPGAPAANARPAVQAPAPGGALPDPQAEGAPSQVVPGAYRHARGQYSDQASGMGMPAGFTGQPNAQNMAAADALAGRSQQESMNRVTARGMGALAGGPGSGPVEPGSFTGGFSGVIGTDPRIAQQERERSALVSALSSPLRGAQNGQLTASQRQGMAGLLEAERRDASSNRQADQTAATQQSIAAMREAGDNGRAFLREDGENTRSTARNQIDARRYNDEASARAVDMRAAQRRESAYDNYSKAKTDEDRQAIAKQFPDLFGQAKDAAHRMEVVRGKTDPMTGQSSGDYVVVQDPKTGGVRQIQMGASTRLPPLAENPAVQQIMNNTSLSREERAKQIRALGYQ